MSKLSVFNLTTCLFILSMQSVVGEDQLWRDFAAKRFAKEKPLQLVPTQQLPEVHKRFTQCTWGPDFGPYMVNLQKRVNAIWQRSENARVVVVTFKVYTDGSISDLRIDKSCGIAKEDQCALDAMRKSSPFEHLPEGAPEVIDIQFTFDDKVFRKRPAAKNSENVDVRNDKIDGLLKTARSFLAWPFRPSENVDHSFEEKYLQSRRCAESFLLSAVELGQKTFGAEQPLCMVEVYSELARVYQELGESPKEEAALKQAASIYQKKPKEMSLADELRLKNIQERLKELNQH